MMNVQQQPKKRKFEKENDESNNKAINDYRINNLNRLSSSSL